MSEVKATYAHKKANLLKLVQILCGKDPVSYKTLVMEFPGCSRRTLYGYLRQIEKQYGLERRRRPFLSYRIRPESVNTSATLAESDINRLRQLLAQEPDPALDAKLAAFLRPAKNLFKERYPEKYNVLEECMEKKFQVHIGKYRSRDNLIGPLVVHPIGFDAVNAKLFGFYYDQNEQAQFRDFKVESMEEIVIIPKSAHVQKQNFKIDFFGFRSGAGTVFKVRLQLTQFAYSMLLRQFRKITHHILYNKDLEWPYELKLTVFDIQPIARFATGILDEVRICGDKATKKAIKAYIDKRVKKGYVKNFDQNIG